MKPQGVISVIVILFIFVAIGSSKVGVAQDLPPLPKPRNIACLGFARDEVFVAWRDDATDETNYRVERKIGDGDFVEVATMLPNEHGGYVRYRDTNIDFSKQERRYRMRAYRASDNSFSPYSEVCNNRRMAETQNFRFFYGVRDTTDDCPLVDGNQVCVANENSNGANIYITRQIDTLEGSLAAFKRVGFTRTPIPWIPVNIVWCDSGGCNGDLGPGLSPYMIERQFDLATRAGDPIAWLVPEHEVFHFQQGQYPGLQDPSSDWVIEGQARFSQDKICIGADRNNCQSFDDIDTGEAGYVPQVRAYLGNPNRPINQAEYSAALFWTYLTEKYGTSAPNDPVEGGMNLITKFWDEVAATPGRNGIAVLNSTLAALGHTAHFRDVWKDFAVASYAKDISGAGVPAKYRYADMAQPGGNYGPVKLTISRELKLGEQVVNSGETVHQWGAQYYEVRPAADLPMIAISFKQDSRTPLYYKVLGIKGNDLVYEYESEGRNLEHTLVNDGFSRVVVVVAGLETLANYRYSFNGVQPALRILQPTTVNNARVGDPIAPDKFRVAVEVIGGDGAPLAGVNLANFRFRVGDKDVPMSDIVTRATVQGQQWFIVNAPTQGNAGLYDLSVSYGAVLANKQLQSVNYIPRDHANSMLIIDRSGSMTFADKMGAAKNAAKLYIDSLAPGDNLGIVSFSTTPNLDMTLREWSTSPDGGSRQSALTTIDALVAGGFTTIGDALRTGWNELDAHGNRNDDWALVLLSDGKEEGPVIETFRTVLEAIIQTTKKRPAIHTLAIGPDADRPRMQEAAIATGGDYHYVSLPSVAAASVNVESVLQLQMDTAYRTIATDIAGRQAFFRQTAIPVIGETTTFTIPVEADASEFSLALSFSLSNASCPRTVSVGLVTPNGGSVPPSVSINARQYLWQIAMPRAGNWKLVLYFPICYFANAQANASSALNALSTYLIQGEVRSNTAMDVYLATRPKEQVAGVPMPILASLTDNGPILGATVTGTIEISDTQYMIILLDDGVHGDGAANDGLYGNTFYQTGSPGSYNLVVIASGNSANSGLFVRRKALSFHLDSTGDRDGDGLPDEWEERFDTNPDGADASQDPDIDFSTNKQEWERGTDPLDPDTDDGGEADGGDELPHDPSNDEIKPTWAVAYPGNNQVIVQYMVDPAHLILLFYRGSTPNGPFEVASSVGQPLSGVFTDTNVVNDTQYCYTIVALTSFTTFSPTLTPSCATPKADYNLPHGSLLINNGARTTFVPDVTLTLWASDMVSPENESPGQESNLFGSTVSGVTEMMISNSADMKDGVWEPFVTTKPWQLRQTLGLTSVFVKYRDAVGNESAIVPATIHIVTQQKSDQTINFDPLSAKTLGDPPFTLSATTSSSLPITFNTSTPSVCTVSGVTVTLVGAGICTITALQEGDAAFNAAAPVTQSFFVNMNSSTIKVFLPLISR